jgi:hypothetical protein
MTEVLEFPEGRVRGRAVPELPLHTFKDSGEQVRLRKLGPVTVQRITEQIRKEAKALPEGHDHKMPEPPVQEVDVAGVVRHEKNETDPGYLRAMQRWQTWLGGETNERFLRVCAVEGVVPERPEEEWRGMAQRVRSALAREGVALEWFDAYDARENDLIVYLQHVCFGSTQDMQEFYGAMTNRSTPTPQAVEDATALFRPAPAS